jgi:hypothetical protein
MSGDADRIGVRTAWRLTRIEGIERGRAQPGLDRVKGIADLFGG